MSTLKNAQTQYSALGEEDISHAQCIHRSDDEGWYNFSKAWLIFVLQIALSLALYVTLIQIDGRHFLIGHGPTIFSWDSTLYQVQMTALISIGLVIIRLVTGICCGLLSWRIIYILLEKRGLTLPEILRLANTRIPVLPVNTSRRSLLWFLWTTISILLFWPPILISPLASASISWIPASRDTKTTLTNEIAALNETSIWPMALLYPAFVTKVLLDSLVAAGRDPSYAYSPQSSMALRRYFNATTTDVIGNSKIDMLMPQISVDLDWIDPPAGNQSDLVVAPILQDVDPGIGIRQFGTVAVIRQQPWDAWSDSVQLKEPRTFHGTKIIAVKLRTLNFGDVLPDGTVVDNTTACPAHDGDFGELPAVRQHQVDIVGGTNLVAYDCYIFARATIIAGTVFANSCNVTAVQATSDRYATCEMVSDNEVLLRPHPLTHTALDFTSQTLKFTSLQGYTSPELSRDLDIYTRGSLVLGYQAAWSALMNDLGTIREEVTYRPAQSVVSAQVDHTKALIWLLLNTTLLISALLLILGQSLSGTKTIRDTTLAALTLDIAAIAHDRRAKGLCNSSALSRSDHRLPRIKWRARGDAIALMERGDKAGSCCRSVSFVDEPIE